MALQLSVWDVYGIEGDKRLVLVGSFPEKCFFLEEDYSLVLKGWVLCQTDSHPGCVECEKGMRVPVHPTLLLLSST